MVHWKIAGAADTPYPDSQFGYDLLENHPNLQDLRERDFSSLYPESSNVFEDILHGNGHLSKNCLSYFILLTRRFALLLQ